MTFPRPDAASCLAQVDSQEFSSEALRLKAAAVAEVALRALLYHLKPGQAATLYSLACHACRQRMAAASDNPAAGMLLSNPQYPADSSSRIYGYSCPAKNTHARV